MENRINKIMELSDGSKYIVVKQAIYRNENYFVVAKITSDEENVENDFKVVHEVINDAKSTIEEVNDEGLFKLIIKYVGLEE